MGFSGIGPGSLLLIAVIVALLFGTQRLRSLGRDVGEAVKGFKSAMREEEGAGDSDPSSGQAASTQRHDESGHGRG